MRRVRPDVRVLINRLLARIPEVHDLCFFVDSFEGRRATERSRAGLPPVESRLLRVPTILDRYLGRPDAARYLAHHRRAAQRPLAAA